jgi:hypothetical protein
MKYFIDTEFIEGFNGYRKRGFWDSWFTEKKLHSVDLISIGIVAEDGRTYYAISNQFEPDDADKWVKDNVLYPIMRQNGYDKPLSNLHGYLSYDRKAVKSIQRAFGKHPVTIGLEVREFCGGSQIEDFVTDKQIEFYGYFSDYDWVVFCSMFGTMMNLPKGFPMYCKDLKQYKDDLADRLISQGYGTHTEGNKYYPKDMAEANKWIEDYPAYPTQSNEHNALDDAKWNFKLYKFLNSF